MTYRIKKQLYHAYWKLIDLCWLFIAPKKQNLAMQKSFSIGIVTYVDRYEIFFKSLINRLAYCCPDTEIVVVVNGYYDIEKQRAYLQQIKLFLSKFKQVKIIDFEEPQSLSKLWNLALINASNEKILIMNDDLKIAPWFGKELKQCKVLENNIALVNRSWSHFVIAKQVVKEIGYFDERFPAVGNEDEDYECRLVLKGIRIETFRMNSLKNIVFKTKNFSYGENISTVNDKYVKANKIFFDKKWSTSETAKEGYVFVEILNLFVKLKIGMETPNFYQS